MLPLGITLAVCKIGASPWGNIGTPGNRGVGGREKGETGLRPSKKKLGISSTSGFDVISLNITVTYDTGREIVMFNWFLSRKK